MALSLELFLIPDEKINRLRRKLITLGLEPSGFNDNKGNYFTIWNGSLQGTFLQLRIGGEESFMNQIRGKEGLYFDEVMSYNTKEDLYGFIDSIDEKEELDF